MKKKQLSFSRPALASAISLGLAFSSLPVFAEIFAVTENITTSSSELGGKSNNYATADGDDNFYDFTVNPDKDFNTVTFNGTLSGNLNLIVDGSASQSFTITSPQS